MRENIAGQFFIISLQIGLENAEWQNVAGL
jgi:hypothetical protein